MQAQQKHFSDQKIAEQLVAAFASLSAIKTSYKDIIV